MPRPTRDQPQLTRQLIEDTALLLIDAEGLERMSMRRLARALGVAPGSLYHWIPNKKALLEVLYVRALQTIELPASDASLDWRAELRRVCHSFRALWLQHPGFVPVLIGHASVNRTELAFRERLDVALELAGVGDGIRLAAIEVLPAFLFGVMVSENRGDFSAERGEALRTLARTDPNAFPRMAHRTLPSPDHLFDSALQIIEFAIEGMRAETAGEASSAQAVEAEKAHR